MSSPTRFCQWCGRSVTDSTIGRRRQYCRQSCRQRAYEQRNVNKNAGLPPDVFVLTAREAADLADRSFAARCAAEDVATAIREGVHPAELAALADTLVELAREAERLR